MNRPIYLDYAATTPMDPRVLEAMLPYFTSQFGNAGSGTHFYGMTAKAAVNLAREKIAQEIGADASEIIFTSGATESLNIGIKSVFNLYHLKGKHIITCKTEHKAVLDTLEFLEKKGAEVTYLNVHPSGEINLEELNSAIRSDTILICLMSVNNETGVIHPIYEIAKIAEKHQVVFLTDASQALGKIPLNVSNQYIGLMALSAHKIYGPKGIGVLYVSRKNPRVSLQALIHGGGQEKNLRAGTLNVPAIVGFGKAVELLNDQDEIKRIKNFKQDLLAFFDEIGAKINADFQQTVPQILNVCWNKFKATDLIKKNPNLAFSLGSACTSELLQPSHVLSAMALSEQEIKSSFRISLGRMTTLEEVNGVMESFKRC